MATAAADIDALMKRVTFGTPHGVEFGTNGDSIADGGWVNATVPVLLDGAVIGDARIGAWIYTGTESANISSDVYDEVTRTGWAIRAYRGHDRDFDSAPNIEELVSDEDAVAWEIEKTILDAAEEHADIDYGEVYAAALRTRLEATQRDDVYRLIQAVRALEE